jgi:hypothetical protein
VPPRRAEADAPFAEPFALGVEVVDEEAELCAADVLEAAGAGGSGRRQVLEQLEVVAVPAEVADPHFCAGDAGDLFDIVACDLPVGHHLEAEVAGNATARSTSETVRAKWWTPVITGTRFALRSFPRK